MSIKFIKVRFNMDNPDDRKLYEMLNGMKGQNSFIKNAITSYSGKGTEEAIAEKVATILLDKLGTMPLTLSSQPVTEEITDETSFSESADIADAFLDSL